MTTGTDQQPTADRKLYCVSWRNKRTGVESYEDFVDALRLEDAIRKTKRLIAQSENGVAVADIEITDVGERHA